MKQDVLLVNVGDVMFYWNEVVMLVLHIEENGDLRFGDRNFLAVRCLNLYSGEQRCEFLGVLLHHAATGGAKIITCGSPFRTSEAAA